MMKHLLSMQMFVCLYRDLQLSQQYKGHVVMLVSDILPIHVSWTGLDFLTS